MGPILASVYKSDNECEYAESMVGGGLRKRVVGFGLEKTNQIILYEARCKVQ